MPFCTIIEFDFGDTFGPDQFADAMKLADDRGPSPEGRLSLIRGSDGATARVIEVWRSGADARAFAEQAAPLLPDMPMPPPTRVSAFEVTYRRG